MWQTLDMKASLIIFTLITVKEGGNTQDDDKDYIAIFLFALDLLHCVCLCAKSETQESSSGSKTNGKKWNEDIFIPTEIYLRLRSLRTSCILLFLHVLWIYAYIT